MQFLGGAPSRRAGPAYNAIRATIGDIGLANAALPPAPSTCGGNPALGQEVAARSASRSARDTVVARAGELDQIEAVAERVGHVGDAAVVAVGDGAVERPAQGDEPAPPRRRDRRR